jgi:SSS family solute:Na+ symporter
MESIDLIVFLAYLIFILLLSMFFYKKKRSSKSFILGHGIIPNWVVSMSIFATFVSSISYLALPGSSFNSNWNPFVFSLSIPFASVMAIKFFVPIYRGMKSTSAYFYLEKRYGLWARIYASICYILTQIVRVGTILYLLAISLNFILGWEINMVIILTGVFVLIYSLLGGITAVLWTDAIQGIILIIGAIVCLILIHLKMPDGPSQIYDIAFNDDKFSLGSFSNSFTESTFWVVLIYGIFINLQNYGIDQNYIQRYLISKSDKKAKASALAGGLLYIPVSAFFLLIGTSLYAYFSVHSGLPDQYKVMTDKVFPFFIVNYIPVGVSGLLISSIFAAGMSTISTSFNCSSTILLEDYYNRLFRKNKSERNSMIFLYLSSLIIAALSVFVALAMENAKSVLDIWWKYASILSGGMLGLFLLGVFTKTDNRSGVVGLFSGIIMIIFLTIYPIINQTEEGLAHPYLTIVLGTITIFLTGSIFQLISYLYKNST